MHQSVKPTVVLWLGIHKSSKNLGVTTKFLVAEG